MTFNVDVDYEVRPHAADAQRRRHRRGRDPQLKATYVAFGAHYDHVGYADGRSRVERRRCRRRLADASARAPPDDRIWNGADDDGSGTVAVMALAHAFATGPRPKRSLLFVWHAGEELGTYGSLYFADHPTVPLDTIVAQLNIDMIGRNRDDEPSEANTVYLVGSDRISSELDQISRDADRDAGRAADARLRDERSRPIPSRSTTAAITTATRRRAFRSSSSRPGSIPTTTRTPTRCRRSSSTS